VSAPESTASPKPTIAELRARTQPPGLLDRRSGEHWAGILYMRKISPYLTRLMLPTGISPNALTGLMIATGLAGAVVVAFVGGIVGAIVAALLVQVYMLLDCVDGEVARWTGNTSTAGIYLDRVGHYLCEAALLVGLGFRGSDLHANGWAVLGLAAALGAVLIKAETDLVDVARARDHKDAVEDAASVPRTGAMALARQFAMLFRFHRLILAVELSLLIVLAAVIDAIRDDLAATHVLIVVAALIAAAQLVLHLVSVLTSSRLR
jgi:phosphatidylglycerophosphate synthase